VEDYQGSLHQNVCSGNVRTALVGLAIGPRQTADITTAISCQPPTIASHKLITTPLPQTLESYDEDSRRTVDYLLSLPTCTGRVGSTGMCLGGHLALRAAVRLSQHSYQPTLL
jgi:dienelactone hydrolase